MDTFTCDWGGELNWWCPPPYLVPRLIRHAQVTGALGTLVVPQWYSAPYWPLLFPDGIHPAEFVKELLVLPVWQSLILPGVSGSSLFNGNPNVEMLALRLDFSKNI